MAKNDPKQRSMALYETILKLKDIDECCRFFDDLCTPTELRSLEQRFDVAIYLQQGLVYLDILEKTGASSATISRVRRSMLDNGAGGVMAAIGWFGAALVGAAISTAILLIWRRHAVKHGNYLTDGVMP